MMGDSQLSEPKTAQVKEAKETMNTEDNKVGHNNKAEEEKKAAKTEDETKAPPGETCHTKRLNRIYEKDGFVVNEDISNSSKVKDKYHKFALTSTQNFDHENKPTKKTLRINSPYILKALGEVVKYYPSQGGGFDQPLDIESPFEILYHHKQELIERKESVDSEVSKEHLNLLLDYLDNEPGAEAEALIKSGKITFDLLWAIFKPGDLIYTIENEHERLYWLQSSSRGNSPWKGEYLRLKCSYHAWDGTLSGRALTDLRVYQNQECPGKTAVAITSLSISSLKYYSDRARIEKKLAARGKIYKNLTERCVRRYDGLCMRLKLPPGSRYYGEEDSFTGVWLPQMATGRVVVDCKTFLEDHNQHRTKIWPWGLNDSETIDGPKDTLMLCPPYVYGYYLNMRCWCQLFVDSVKPVRWEPAAFDSVIMDDAQKETLRSLVRQHRFIGGTRDETELKGKGLAIALHGPPGTGKTFTAEKIAEATEKPLLLFPTGELGSELSDIQTELARLVRYATAWEAVLLIDEADVFLESRESGGQTSLERNALVAVFLRQLEYSQGIIFLTSNRAQMFDPAVRSRIHIMLYYAPPDDAMRRQLWGQKLEPYQHGFKGAIEESLSIIAEYEMNGREISNTVISAKTIADQKLEDMNIDHLQTVLQVWKASQLVASVKPPNNNRVILRKMAPWLLRLVMFTLFCGALRSSYVGIRKFKNKLVQFLSRSKC